MKKIIKPFDVESAIKGAHVETRCGQKVRILCYDKKSFPIVALIGEAESISSYLLNGKETDNSDTPRASDLVIVEYIEEPDKWSERNELVEGFAYNREDGTFDTYHTPFNETINPASKKLAERIDAMVQISHILQNDKKYGGIITDEEWNDSNTVKFTLTNYANSVNTDFSYAKIVFLAFHTKKQREDFLNDYPELVKDYLMID